MKLQLIRKEYTNKSTIGELFIWNDEMSEYEFFCYTIEDVVRMFKIPDKTAIDAGVYKVILNMSNRFKKIMPLLLDVPNFTGIRIHYGNFAGNEIFYKNIPIQKNKDVLYSDEYVEVI